MLVWGEDCKVEIVYTNVKVFVTLHKTKEV